MKPEIECKVAKILSSTELVISAGHEDKVEEGMVFNVMGSVPIKDPDSDEILESISLVKISAKVSKVGTRVSIVETLSDNRFASLFRSVEKEQIPIDNLSGEEGWDKTVRIGDQVVLALTESETNE